MKDNKTKTFADISKDIQKKYEDRYDPISVRGLKAEMKRLRDMQEEFKTENGLQAPTDTEQYFLGGINGKFEPTTDVSVSGQLANVYNNLNSNLNSGEQPYGRDPLMYASALGPIAALFNNKRPDPIDRSEAGRFIDSGDADKVSPRQTEFGKISMSPIERAISERARGFSGNNANSSGGQGGAFIANELANQSNILDATGNAKLQQQQSNLNVDGMNAQEQARIDAFKLSNAERGMKADQVNAGLALQYDEIDAMNEGAWRTNNNNAIQGIFSNLGAIGRENTQNNILLRALGYDEMGNYGGKGKNSFRFLDSLLSKVFKQ